MQTLTRETVNRFDGNSIQFIWQTDDGQFVESKFFNRDSPEIPNTYCIATQIGCHVDCRFCHASPEGGVHNLSREIMFDQVIGAIEYFKQHEIESDYRDSWLAFMGSGEPMHNLKNVLTVKEQFNASERIGHETYLISTSGWVPGIRVITQRDPNYELCISLHASDEGTRNDLIPSENTYDITSIIDAGRKYYEESGIQVTINYTLIDGVNDQKSDAIELADRLDPEAFRINMLHLIDPPDKSLERTADRRIVEFNQVLVDAGYETGVPNNINCPV